MDIDRQSISLDQLIDFVKEFSGSDEVEAHTDIFGSLGVVGDDFHELMEKYAEKFAVDMNDYLWYFHADEEGINPGNLFFKAPYQRVDRIEVHPGLLLEFAREGKWLMEYPPHLVPNQRYDVLFNLLIGVGVVLYLFFLSG